MPAVKHIADIASIDGHSLLNELRVCLKGTPRLHPLSRMRPSPSRNEPSWSNAQGPA